MITSKTIVLAVLIAIFILLVAIDGRRKITKKRQDKSDMTHSVKSEE